MNPIFECKGNSSDLVLIGFRIEEASFSYLKNLNG